MKEQLSELSKAFSPKCRSAYLSVLSLGLGCYGGMGACSSSTCSAAWQSVKDACKPSDKMRNRSMKSSAAEVLSMCGEAGTCEARAIQMAQLLQSDQTCGEESFCVRECKLTICSTIDFVKSCCSGAATTSDGNLKMMCAIQQSGSLKFENLMVRKGCPCESNGLPDLPATTTTTTTTPASSPCSATFVGQDLGGVDVQKTTAIGSCDAELDASCCSLCDSNSDCQFWVRETGSVGPKTCWLKKDARTYTASMKRRGALKQARRLLGVPAQSKPASRGLRGACVHC